MDNQIETVNKSANSDKSSVIADFAASLIPAISIAKSIVENKDTVAHAAEAVAAGAISASAAGAAGKVINEGVKGVAEGAQKAIQNPEKALLPALEVVSGTVVGGAVGGGVVFGKWAGEQVINNLPQIKNTIKDGYKHIGNGIDAMFVPKIEK
ncbi:MAG: hypothetical protein K2W82_00970 [Candidatus Obscuribacterales bacterium]|nr:hypothetical protein [Candidatus Obscuribacterales bacterium]